MTDATYPNLLDDAEVDAVAETSGCGGHCTCGEQQDSAPELDARLIPPAVRHAAIFGALGAVRPGSSMVLIAPHAPVPLLEQLEAAEPGVWTTAMSQSGPEEWRVHLTRAL
jgi:uncharacterized protein (DUF2249 family)